MKRAIYIIITLILNIVAIIVFRTHITISEMSSMSVIFMLMLGFFAWQFKIVKRGEMSLNAGTSSTLNDEEISTLGRVLETVSIGAIPLLIPFIFFFNDKVKVIVPTLVLCSFVIVGMLAFRIIYGKKIKARLDAECRERDEQERRERGDM